MRAILKSWARGALIDSLMLGPVWRGPMLSAILSWLKGAIIPAAAAATFLGPIDYRAINGVTGALSYAPTTGAFTQAACAGLSNAGTACTANTGTSGANVPLLNAANTWSAQQSVTPTTLSISTATFTPDGSSNNYALTLVHASCPCTLANPSTTPVAGTGGQIEIVQSSTGSDTIGTWGSEYESPGGTATLTLSTGANAVDILSYYVIDSTHIAVSLQKTFSH